MKYSKVYFFFSLSSMRKPGREKITLCSSYLVKHRAENHRMWPTVVSLQTHWTNQNRQSDSMKRIKWFERRKNQVSINQIYQKCFMRCGRGKKAVAFVRYKNTTDINNKNVLLVSFLLPFFFSFLIEQEKCGKSGRKEKKRKFTHFGIAMFVE